MTGNTLKRTFENELVTQLVSNGWLEGEPQKYNQELGLYPDDVIGWLQESQPEVWKKAHYPAQRQYGSDAFKTSLPGNG